MPVLSPGLAFLLSLAAAPPADAPVPAPGSAAPTAPSPAPQAPEALPPDTPDDPEIAREVEEESRELEEARASEEAALGTSPSPAQEGALMLRRLGFGSPLRQSLQCSEDELELDELAERFELQQVTDLANLDVSALRGQYDIPIEMRPLVLQYIQYFQGKGRKWFRKWMSRSTRYIPMMQPILESAGLPKDTVYLAMIESGFSAQAYSWAHAAGPWQFISATGKRFGLHQDFWVDERRDPIKATHAAAGYLRELKGQLGHWYLAWAGYNAGAGKVRRVVGRKGTEDFWQLIEGRGFARETKHYVPKLIACAIVAKNYRAFGFTDDEFGYLPPLEYEEVQLTQAADLEVVARAAGVPVEDIQELNPELKRWCTPPASEEKPYVLRVPKGAAQTFGAHWPKLSPSERLAFKVHRVKRGDTLSKIALTYRSAPEAIMRMNGIRTPRALKLNSDLVIPVPSGHKGPDEVFSRQVTQARRTGFVAARPEEEIPAGTQPARKAIAQGTIRSEVVDGRTRVTYGVATGDSLWSIAQHFNVTVEELRAWNPGLSQRRRGLQIGTPIVLYPGPARHAASSAAATSSKPIVVSPGAVPASGGAGAATAPAAAAMASPKGKRHTIVSGDSLWSIARQYGVTVEDLKRWNGLEASALQVGQELTVAQ